jgi:hypothetical protein
VSFTALTSLLLVLECQVFAILLAMRGGGDSDLPTRTVTGPFGPKRRRLVPGRRAHGSWTGFFVVTAVANAFGAAKHGWPVRSAGPPAGIHPEAPGLLLVTVMSSGAGMLAVTLAQLAVLSRLRIRMDLALKTLVWLQCAGAVAWLILRPDDFRPVLLHSAVGLGSVMLGVLADPSRGRWTGLVLAGLVVIAAAGGLFALDLTLPMGLTRSDAGHLIMAGGFALIYLGVSRMPPSLRDYPEPVAQGA